MIKDNTSNQNSVKDKEILENILSIAHGLLGYNKGHRCFDWGQSLYDIHKYLESRLSPNSTEFIGMNDTHTQDFLEILDTGWE